MFDIHEMFARRLGDLIHDIEEAVKHPDIGTVLTALDSALNAYQNILHPTAEGEQPGASVTP